MCEHEPVTKLQYLRISSPPIGGSGQVWSAPCHVCRKCGVVYVELSVLEEIAALDDKIAALDDESDADS